MYMFCIHCCFYMSYMYCIMHTAVLCSYRVMRYYFSIAACGNIHAKLMICLIICSDVVYKVAKWFDDFLILCSYLSAKKVYFAGT